MTCKCLHSKGQGATEYLVLLAVVLVIALVGIALLSFFPGTSTDNEITSSQIYWQGVPTPFHVNDATFTNNGIEFEVTNSASGPETLYSMVINNELAYVNSISDPVTFAPGETREILAGGISLNYQEGQIASLDLKFSYTDENHLSLTETGTKPYLLRANELVNITSNSTSNNSSCSGYGGNCSAGSDCCSGLACETDYGVCANCLTSGQSTCTKDSDCCSGLVCTASSGGTTCIPSSDLGCSEQSQVCGGAAACCSGLVCSKQYGPDDLYITGFCATCLPKGGWTCSSNSDCCSGLTCQNGTCNTAPACGESGGNCTNDSDCCSGYCYNGVCATPGCSPDGAGCSGPSSCCGGYCNSCCSPQSYHCSRIPPANWGSACNQNNYWSCVNGLTCYSPGYCAASPTIENDGTHVRCIANCPTSSQYPGLTFVYDWTIHEGLNGNDIPENDGTSIPLSSLGCSGTTGGGSVYIFLNILNTTTGQNIFGNGAGTMSNSVHCEMG